MTPNEEMFEQLNSRIEAIEGQRNRALADHAIVYGDLALERLKRKQVELDFAELKKLFDATEKKE